MISLNLLFKISFFLSLCFHRSFSSMGSNFHYSIDLNEDQNHHEEPLFYPFGSSSSILHNQHHHHQVPSNSSSSISSLSPYLPFLINSQEDQHVAYNNTYHADHLHLSQPLKAKMFNGGSSSSSYDHTVPKKKRRVKLTIRKKDHQDDQTDFLHQNPTKPNSGSDKWLMSPKMRLIKKTITNSKQPTDHTNSNDKNNKEDHFPLDHKTTFKEDNDQELKKVSTRTTTAATTENRYNTINENGYGNNNGVIRVCSDCNTTKTPLWRSGPRGPKSLCNACGIRQRKARRAAMAVAAAAGDHQEVVAARLHQLPVKKKLQNKKKRSNECDKYNVSPPVVVKTKKCKLKEEEDGAVMVARDSEISRSTTSSDSSVSLNKFCFDDLTIMLSKSSAYQQVFPQDEKEAAILLMALSYGMVHG